MDRRRFIEGMSLSALVSRFCAAHAIKAQFLNDVSAAYSEPSGTSAGGPVPIPISVAEVANPVIDLGGQWKFSLNPPAEFWNREVDTTSWADVSVPGEFVMQGFDVVEDVEYPCRRKIKIPRDMMRKRFFLRFDGVYGYARVWVNGTYVRDHFGGFTSWDCEITQYVGDDPEFDLVVGVTDRSDDISQASFYAKHSIAGILRKARFFVLPETHIRTISVIATPDVENGNGSLDVSASISPQPATTTQLQFKLTDADGKTVTLDRAAVEIPAHGDVSGFKISAKSPQLWDAEHPHLYMLEVTLVAGGKPVETLQRHIGFRAVERKGNQLLVNGRPVKLHGVCRHSVHPLYGRAIPPEFDDQDASLLRDANINFVRTSHYPPSEEFLAACDRLGIYLEEETAVCWSNVLDGPSSDPRFTARFLSQFREMIERDKDHPSVLFWSLGNESQWGTNFAQEYSFARTYDTSRPLIFSYPDTVHWGTDAYDIYSKHYADVGSDVGSQVFPVLNDEFAHISCYNVDTLRRDPGVRNFWGESISRFGDKFVASDGCLGGSIWAGIDEVFLLPEKPVGYGPWGILDGWRRPKPEYWLTKKAYSPIRIKDRPLNHLRRGPIQVPVLNAYDHTNLSELDIRWKLNGQATRLEGVEVPPRTTGVLAIPVKEWGEDDVLEIQFLRQDGSLVDQYRLPCTAAAPPVYSNSAGEVRLDDRREEVLVEGRGLAITLSRATGLITRATCNGQLLLEGGPYLNLGSGPLEQWLLTSFEVFEKGGCVIARTSGQYGGVDNFEADFEIQIDGSGLIVTRYRMLDEKKEFSHLGVSYRLTEHVERLAWHRLSLWSVYPDDHIGRPKGVAPRLVAGESQKYRSKPEVPWSEDVGDPFLFRDQAVPSGTNDFRSLKEHVWNASCILSDGRTRVRIEADADVAALATPMSDHRVLFTGYNYWSYPDLQWGNYTGTGKPPAEIVHEIRIRLTEEAGD